MVGYTRLNVQKIEKILQQSVKALLASKGFHTSTRSGNKELTLSLKKIARAPFETVDQVQVVGEKLGEKIFELSEQGGQQHLDAATVRKFFFQKDWADQLGVPKIEAVSSVKSSSTAKQVVVMPAKTKTVPVPTVTAIPADQGAEVGAVAIATDVEVPAIATEIIVAESEPEATEPEAMTAEIEPAAEAADIEASTALVEPEPEDGLASETSAATEAEADAPGDDVLAREAVAPIPATAELEAVVETRASEFSEASEESESEEVVVDVEPAVVALESEVSEESESEEVVAPEVLGSEDEATTVALEAESETPNQAAISDESEQTAAMTAENSEVETEPEADEDNHETTVEAETPQAVEA